MQNSQAVEFRLLPCGCDAAAEGAVAVSLPPSPCAVVAEGDAGVRVVAAAQPPLSVALLLEPVRQGSHPPRLLAVATAVGALRVNGAAAPRVAVLREHDLVQWGPEVAFTVELVRRSVLGPPPPEFLGRDCPICRVAFAASDTTFGCACGTRLHAEASPDQLQCAQRCRVCPGCKQPVLIPSAADAESTPSV